MGNDAKNLLSFVVALGEPGSGLYTKSNSDLMEPNQVEVLDNFDLFNEYGSATKIRGTRRLLNTAYTESGSVTRLNSVNFYKSLNVDGSQFRQTLIGAGTTIQKVNSDGTLTSLSTGNRNRPWLDSTFDRFLIMSNQNPFLIGDGDKPKKYDGSDITQLGLTAPGEQETIIEDWITVPSATNATLTAETTTTFRGTSAKVVTGAAGTASAWNRTYTAFEVSDETTDRIRFYFHVPRGNLTDLAQSGAAVSIRFESAAADYYQYDYEIGKIAEGWNELLCNFTVAPSGTAGSSDGTIDLTAINKITYTVNTAAAGTVTTVYFDDVVLLDQGAPSVAQSFTDSILEPFDTDSTTNGAAMAANWTVSDSGTNSLSFDTTEKSPDEVANAGSLRLDKAITTETDITIVNDNAMSLDMSSAVGDVATIRFYIPDAFELRDTSIEIKFGNDSGFVDSATYFVNRSILSAGWNTLEISLLTPDRSTGDGLNLADVDFVEFTFNFEDPATLQDDIRIDKLQINTSTGGALTGAYSYKITFVSRYGIESNAGPKSEDITVPDGGGDISLSDIPTSSDPQIIQRNIYRTVNGGAEWLYLDTIFDNTTTDYTDTTSDGSLVVDTPPEAGLLAEDHSPPPMFGFSKPWKRTIFAAGNPQEPETLYFTDVDEPEIWPLLNAFTFDSRITGIFEGDLSLIITTETDWWRVYGTNPSFSIDKISPGFGAVGPRAVGNMRKVGYAIDRDGARVYGFTNPPKISEPIRDKYEDLDKTNIHDMFSVHSKRYNALLQFNPDSSGSTSSIFIYNYMVDDVASGYWGTITIPSATGIDIRDAKEVEDDTGEFHIYVASADGMLYEFMDPNTFVWTHADGTTTDITSTLTTHYLRPMEVGEGTEVTGQGRCSLQWLELRLAGDLSASGTWTVQAETTEGSTGENTSYHSKTMTFSFPENLALYRIRPQNLNPWEHIRFTIQNTGSANQILRGMRAWVKGYEGPFQHVQRPS